MLFNSMLAVAVDGPAGSGKSTIAKLVADKLGYTYIDTGAMYRAVTLKVMKKEINMSDENGIVDIANDADIKLEQPEAGQMSIRVYLDGEDVSENIRKMEVTGNVKYVCKIPAVRERLVALQRKMAQEMGGVVMEGRDIGTVVLPKARFKFYLDASFDERVERRFAELRAKGSPATREDVAQDLKMRDHTDKTREVGPLRQADDAVFVDTTGLTIEEVVKVITDQVKEQG